MLTKYSVIKDPRGYRILYLISFKASVLYTQNKFITEGHFYRYLKYTYLYVSDTKY